MSRKNSPVTLYSPIQTEFQSNKTPNCVFLQLRNVVLNCIWWPVFAMSRSQVNDVNIKAGDTDQVRAFRKHETIS
jgi:hypothetical protein